MIQLAPSIEGSILRERTAGSHVDLSFNVEHSFPHAVENHRPTDRFPSPAAMSAASHADLRPMRPGGSPRVLDASLAAMVCLLSALAANLVAAELATTLVFSIHVAASLYDGRYDRFRTITWAMIFFGFVALELATLGLAMSIATGGWRGLLSWAVPLCSSLVAIGILFDMVALHGQHVRRSRVAKIVALIAVAVVVAIGANDSRRVYEAVEAAQASKLDMSPPLFGADAFRPYPAFLSSMPPGYPLEGASLLLPFLVGLWPWRQAWRFHAPPTRLAFTALWLGALACWIALGLLGAVKPWPLGAAVSQGLALYELAFLALAPAVLSQFLPSQQSSSFATQA